MENPSNEFGNDSDVKPEFDVESTIELLNSHEGNESLEDTSRLLDSLGLSLEEYGRVMSTWATRIFDKIAYLNENYGPYMPEEPEKPGAPYPPRRLEAFTSHQEGQSDTDEIICPMKGENSFGPSFFRVGINKDATGEEGLVRLVEYKAEIIEPEEEDLPSTEAMTITSITILRDEIPTEEVYRIERPVDGREDSTHTTESLLAQGIRHDALAVDMLRDLQNMIDSIGADIKEHLGKTSL